LIPLSPLRRVSTVIHKVNVTKILVADDNPIDGALLRRLLSKWGYEVCLTTDGSQALALLRQPDGPRLAILDWMMPGLNGPQVCREMQESALRQPVYVLLLTARNSSEDLVTALAAGADDYVSKPFHPDELRARLRAAERILDAQHRLTRENELLHAKATTCPLTGIHNRAAIFEFAQTEFARSKRQGSSVALALADIDNFKTLNDTHGHLAGDAALKQVAQRIQSSVRNYDHVGRYGGAEFLIVLSDCDTRRALIRAEQIRESIAGSPIDIFRGTASVAIAVTISVGVAAGVATDMIEILAAADEALYKAKNNGRNQVVAQALRNEHTDGRISPEPPFGDRLGSGASDEKVTS
jgi:two-component system cell cycle response regulator